MLKYENGKTCYLFLHRKLIYGSAADILMEKVAQFFNKKLK